MKQKQPPKATNPGNFTCKYAGEHSLPGCNWAKGRKQCESFYPYSSGICKADPKIKDAIIGKSK